MTKQQIIKELTDIRNERLYPDGVPLEVGCEIVMDDSTIIETIKVGDLNITDNVLERIDYGCGCCSMGAEPIRNYTNLGKPLSLNDILRLIQGHWITTGGGIYTCADDNIPEEWTQVAFIDLKKEIKDQSEETLSKLIELVK